MPINNLNKLSLTPTSELLEELFTRHDHAVFCGCKNLSIDRGQLLFERKGLYFAQIGMLDYMVTNIRKSEPFREEFK
jgi:hypothetical protein